MQLSTDESKVLVIYTGGTIGMLAGNDGFVPEPFFLTESLRKESRFHDPFDESLFSRASSVQNFRTWNVSRSGSTTPTAKSAPASPPARDEPALPTLLVRSSRPIAQPPNYIDNRQHLSWKIGPECYEAHLPSLITPKVAVRNGREKRIRYAILEWHPLLDSSNMEYSDWIRIATEIELNYATFDAFVILHGTDTMGYTSSALSFLLEDLGKAVIITGAQIPLSQLRNDAIDNLLGALTIAGQYIIPECCLYFNHTLFRGNRVNKASSYDLDAFSSPNFPPLVNVGIEIEVNWNHLLRPQGQKRFRAHKVMCANVVPLRIFPGITAATVRAFLAPHIQGVVLESFGAGNAPGRKDLMDVFKEACDRGVVIVTISQCAKGTVSDSYETGRALLNVGVVPGGDMTAPCALTKLAYLLSKPELSVDQVRQLIRTPLRGEMTVATAVPDPTSPELESTAEVLGHMLRLSNTSDAPSIHITPPVQASGQAAKDATAPGSHTASDAASAQSALLPFLIHLAAARNDIEGIRFCVEADDKLFSAIANPGPDSSAGGAGMSANGSGMSTMTIPGGVVNCLDASTKMSPLHVAALNGGLKAVEVLLDYGALVHQRDVLDHTALYYASRQGHESIVRLLITSGAHLGGTDLGYAEIVLMRAKEMSDERMIRIWQVAGGEAVQNSHHTRPHHIHGAGRQDVGHGKHTLLG